MSQNKEIDMEKLVDEIREQVWEEIGKAYAEKMEESKKWDKVWNNK
jgi:hypothetical protein